MAGITLVAAEAQLALYLAAEAAVLTGQAYEIETGGGRRKLTRANLAEIQQGVKLWDSRVKEISARTGSRGRSRSVVVGG